MRPTASDYAAPHARYVSLVPEEDVVSAIEQQSSETQRLLASVDEEAAARRYAEGKWSVKQVVGHMIDAEQIFAYRALAIARGESASLPAFDEDLYVSNANFDDWSLGDLAELYAVTRRATILFFRNLAEEAWDRRGSANNTPISVRAIAFVILGHERHHLSVLRERYRLG
jgi:uncharacterized damage-inducible protein DinB